MASLHFTKHDDETQTSFTLRQVMGHAWQEGHDVCCVSFARIFCPHVNPYVDRVEKRDD